METKKVTYEALEGCNIGSVQIENGRLIVVYECATPEAPKFKRGDFLCRGADWIFILDFIDEGGVIFYKALFDVDGKAVFGFNNCGIGCFSYNIRLATPEEKQLLLDKMREQGKDWDGEKVIDWVWKPKMGEAYWCVVFSPLRAERVEWCNDSVDNERLKDNRVFATEDLAQQILTELQELLKNAKKY